MDILRPFEQEQAIIGILAGGSTQDTGCIRQLTPEDFSDRELGSIFAACLRLLEQHIGVTLATLDEHLMRTHGADQGAEMMQTVMAASTQHSFTGWKLPEAVRIVGEASRRRGLVRIGEAISRGAADEQRELDELLDTARNHMRSSSSGSGGWISAQDAILAAYEALERAEKPIPTGIKELDNILQGGLHNGELTVLGARPAVGKSAVLLHIATEAAHAGKHVVYVSLEMSDQQLGARLLGRYSGINTGMLRGGTEPTERQWAILAQALAESGEYLKGSLHLAAKKGMTLEELSSEIISLHDSGLCDLLVVDYLQLLNTRRQTGTDFERLGIVSRGLKAVTLDLDIPVLTAAQVKRQNNGGILRAPGLDELRGSGDIEQDADNVILLHRPETSDDDPLLAYCRHKGCNAEEVLRHVLNERKTLMHFNVAKQRQGATGSAWSLFDPARMRFESPDSVVREAN